jgi:hypothetical protein
VEPWVAAVQPRELAAARARERRQVWGSAESAAEQAQLEPERVRQASPERVWQAARVALAARARERRQVWGSAESAAEQAQLEPERVRQASQEWV